MPSIFDEAIEKEFESIASEVSLASDFMTAIRLLAGRLSTLMDSRKLGIFCLNPAGTHLQAETSRGFNLQDVVGSLSLEELSNPIVLSARTLTPLRTVSKREFNGEPDEFAIELGFRNLTVIPMPQPRIAKLDSLKLPLNGVNEWEEVKKSYETVNLLGRNYLREAFSPFGVLVVESDEDQSGQRTVGDTQILAITWFMRFVGPVIWRHIDRYKVESHNGVKMELEQDIELLRSLINSIPDPMVISTDDYGLSLQNRRAKELLEMPEDTSSQKSRAIEVNNALFSSIIEKMRGQEARYKKVDGNSAVTQIEQYKKGKYELNLIDPETSDELLFEIQQQNLNGGEGAATINILRDVTDLKRASNELERQIHRVKLAEFDAKRERDRLTLILENVADPIVVTDDLSNVILLNRKGEAVFKHLNNSILENKILIDQNLKKFREFISEFVVSSDVARRRQMILNSIAGEISEFPVEIVSGKILDSRGDTLAVVSVLHDLSNHVEIERLYHQLKKFSSELEERVAEATADLAERNERLQWQSNELERANRLKSEFLASMSHELRTPINALLGYTSIMLDRIYGDLTDKQAEGLERMQTATQHLLALINDILDLARIESGRMPLNLSNVKLSSIISEINFQVEPLSDSKGLQYHSIIPETPVILYTDKTKLKQIMLNLLSNAIKFTPSGSVTLKASVGVDTISIEVSDTGIGIREEDMEKVWDDFRQVDQSMTREYGGTGLGLSIIKRLTQSLGGSVYLKSRYGRGSTFIINLPLTTSSTQEQAPVIDTFG